MYHARFKGTHYEAGFRWGSLLFQHQNFILEHIPFEITRERIDYARACLPVYEKFYPEILEEIKGLADGQHSDVRPFQALLLSMYAIPPSCQCSCLAVSDGQHVLLGRNSDFLPELEKRNMNVIYRLSDGTYAFTGNTTACVEMEDGVNEHALAAGLTSVFPTARKPGFNAGMLVRYLLEKCRTVKEALAHVRRLPIGSAQTLTLADPAGHIALVECNARRTAIADFAPENSFDAQQAGTNQFGAEEPEANRFNGEASRTGHAGTASFFVCATNRFHLPEMADCNPPGIDDWFAGRRWQTLHSCLGESASAPPLSLVQEILSGKRGFLCQYERRTGKDTVWSVVYDLRQKKIWRCEKNPSRGAFREDCRFRMR